MIKFKAGQRIQYVPMFPDDSQWLRDTFTDCPLTVKGGDELNGFDVTDEDGNDYCLANDLINRFALLPHEPELKASTDLSAFRHQVAGDHYKKLGIQPIELVLMNRGYIAFSGACYTKIVKYMDRKKDNEVEQLKKARHVLDMWIEQAEKEQSSTED